MSKGVIYDKIHKWGKQDLIDGGQRLEELAVCLKVTKNYLIQKIKLGTYKPSEGVRERLAGKLGIGRPTINKHFKDAVNVVKGEGDD